MKWRRLPLHFLFLYGLGDLAEQVVGLLWLALLLQVLLLLLLLLLPEVNGLRAVFLSSRVDDDILQSLGLSEVVFH